jgi:hypothetical protein
LLKIMNENFGFEDPVEAKKKEMLVQKENEM